MFASRVVTNGISRDAKEKCDIFGKRKEKGRKRKGREKLGIIGSWERLYRRNVVQIDREESVRKCRQVRDIDESGGIAFGSPLTTRSLITYQQ